MIKGFSQKQQYRLEERTLLKFCRMKLNQNYDN